MRDFLRTAHTVATDHIIPTMRTAAPYWKVVTTGLILVPLTYLSIVSEAGVIILGTAFVFICFIAFALQDATRKTLLYAFGGAFAAALLGLVIASTTTHPTSVQGGLLTFAATCILFYLLNRLEKKDYAPPPLRLTASDLEFLAALTATIPRNSRAFTQDFEWQILSTSRGGERGVLYDCTAPRFAYRPSEQLWGLVVLMSESIRWEQKKRGLQVVSRTGEPIRPQWFERHGFLVETIDEDDSTQTLIFANDIGPPLSAEEIAQAEKEDFGGFWPNRRNKVTVTNARNKASQTFDSHMPLHKLKMHEVTVAKDAAAPEQNAAFDIPKFDD